MIVLRPPLLGDLNNLLTSGRHTPAKKVQQSIDEIIVDTEAAVMANFEFLGATEMSDDDEISDDLEMVATDNDDTDVKLAKRAKSGKDMLTEGKSCSVDIFPLCSQPSPALFPHGPASPLSIFVRQIIANNEFNSV